MAVKLLCSRLRDTLSHSGKSRKTISGYKLKANMSFPINLKTALRNCYSMSHVPSVSVKSEVLFMDKSDGGSVGLNTLFFVSFRNTVLLLVLIELLTDDFLFVLLCTPLLLLLTFELFVRGFLLTPAPTFFPFRLLENQFINEIIFRCIAMYN